MPESGPPLSATGTAPITDTEPVRLVPAGKPAKRLTLLVPDNPDVEWLYVATPVEQQLLDDTTQTPRSVALQVAKEMRDTAEMLVYDKVLQRRKDGRDRG